MTLTAAWFTVTDDALEAQGRNLVLWLAADSRSSLPNGAHTDSSVKLQEVTLSFYEHEKTNATRRMGLPPDDPFLAYLRPTHTRRIGLTFTGDVTLIRGILATLIPLTDALH